MIRVFKLSALLKSIPGGGQLELPGRCLAEDLLPAVQIKPGRDMVFKNLNILERLVAAAMLRNPYTLNFATKSVDDSLARAGPSLGEEAPFRRKLHCYEP
jgi:hypothetical protein